MIKAHTYKIQGLPAPGPVHGDPRREPARRDSDESLARASEDVRRLRREGHGEAVPARRTRRRSRAGLQTLDARQSRRHRRQGEPTRGDHHPHRRDRVPRGPGLRQGFYARRATPPPAIAMHFATKAIHTGQEPDPRTGAVTPPIYMTSTYSQKVQHDYVYGRGDNPTRDALQQSLAALEEGQQALCFSSGMGAITTALTLLAHAEHAAAADGHDGL